MTSSKSTNHYKRIGDNVVLCPDQVQLEIAIARETAALLCIASIARIWLEDGILQRELDGYPAYT